MEKSHETALSHMRKSLEKLGSSTDMYGDETLMRFLNSKGMDAEKAAKMFVQWEKWRREFVPLGYIPDSEVQEELEHRKIYLQGLSKQGHPIMLSKACNHKTSKDRTQFKKFMVHIVDKTIASSFNGREIGNEMFIQVLDLKGISYKNSDVRGMISGFQILQDYYPNRLFKFYVLNMPGFFVSLWKIVCRFLDKSTLDKIVIVSTEEEVRQFISEIGEEALPEEYGGRSQLIAIQDFALPQATLDLMRK